MSQNDKDLISVACCKQSTPARRNKVRARFLRALQGEDKPSPLLWTTWSPARSIVGESCLEDRYNGLSSPSPGYCFVHQDMSALQKSYAHVFHLIPTLSRYV